MTTAAPDTLQPSTAALLAYLLMPLFCGLPIPGALMLVIEKSDRFVRFHAWQSLAFGAVLWGASLLLALMAAITGAVVEFIGEMFGLLRFLWWCGGIVVWVLCLVRTYRHQAWRIPLLGDWAAKRAGWESA